MIEEMDKEAAALKLDPTRKPVMTEEVIVSQCVVFFLAGFDTTGSTLSMCCHFLALDQEVQQKCLNEIRSTMKKFEGKICHEMIAECHYLDQILNESLRIVPPTLRLERVCTHPCTVQGIKFRKDDVVTVPIYAIHNLEENFPDPEKFDPDRMLSKVEEPSEEEILQKMSKTHPNELYGHLLEKMSTKVVLWRTSLENLSARAQTARHWQQKCTDKSSKLVHTVSLAPDNQFWMAFGSELDTLSDFHPKQLVQNFQCNSKWLQFMRQVVIATSHYSGKLLQQQLPPAATYHSGKLTLQQVVTVASSTACGRFAPENKGNIKPFTYLPFGNGIRNCIGMRFAQEEIKLALATIVHNFKLSKCEKTNVPFKTKSHAFMIQPLEMFVKFDKRE
ncbi:unnamed protein product [Notodromas monacha]|uniref:Cytochrome P450 n=1 Tax=Notodromas monacha TaxID=399045 RepID=A0A7R9BZA6_9CRUS|nr:unnamed protein product [Notodromas monacha]CAG0924440.1 unnamed protein product [Notodromas monacha]